MQYVCFLYSHIIPLYYSAEVVCSILVKIMIFIHPSVVESAKTRVSRVQPIAIKNRRRELGRDGKILGGHRMVMARLQ